MPPGIARDGIRILTDGVPIDLAGHALINSVVNDWAVLGSDQDGIRVGRDCVIKSNTCTQNARYGIYVTAINNRLENNSLIENDYGVFVPGSNNLVVANTASANTNINYSIAAGNAYGPVVGVRGSNDLSAVTDADHPLANLAF